MIVVPINVAALRVSPSTPETAKTALYDFSTLGTSPLSSGGSLIAADRFLHAEETLDREPGIHLHWSLPQAYTQGAQSNMDGALNFPGLPNRWLVTRFFQNLADGTSSASRWILEADAHAKDAADVNAATITLPWMDEPSDLYGLDYHFVGRRLALTGSWNEPGTTPPAGVSYLGRTLQAPLAYGPTFTAYYRQARNLFGLYDDLSDLFAPAGLLESNCRFTVSYSVVGWVSPSSNDAVVAVLNGAVDAYNQRPSNDTTTFAGYVQQAIEAELKWTLDDYSGFTLDNVSAVQGVLSGAITGIQWDISSPRNPVYPSALPDASSVSTAIGNNNPEALSAYLNALDNQSSSSDPGDVVSNLEWLLNALQFGRLPYLDAAEMGVGQLDEYLHARSFGSRAGGYRWSVRHVMTPGSKAAPKAPVDVTLPLPLAKLLSQLNDRQEQYDARANEIRARQQKLFFDWNYHINAIETNVIGGSSPIGSDTSGAFLLDGLMHLLPIQLSAGAAGRIDVQGGPYAYVPAPVQIAAPGDQFSSLAPYQFNDAANANAALAVNQLLAVFSAIEGTIPVGLDMLAAAVDQARDLVFESLAGGTTAASYLTQAIAAAQSAQASAAALAAAFARATDTTSGLAAVKATIDADQLSLAALLDPSTGVFAQFLPVVSNDPVPTPPGQVYSGRMASFAAFRDAASWGASGNFKGMGDVIDQLTGQGAYQPHVFDTQLAAMDVATAYFWRQSGDSAAHSTPYHLQMAAQEIAGAQSDAQSASAALQQAIAALTGNGTVNAVGQSLNAIAAVALPRIVSALTSVPADAVGALVQLDELLGGASRSRIAPGQSVMPWPLPALQAAVAGADWLTFTASIETAWLTILDRLPLAHRVSILSTFLAGSIQGIYELSSTPAATYWQPNEPVLLLAQPAGAGDLIRPVNRNGFAPLLPCRLDSEILTPTTTVAWPAVVSTIASDVNPSIAGLASVLQQLVQEAWLLNLQTPASQMTGVQPYAIAWNQWSGQDDFLPLFIFWQAEYVYSQRIDFATEGVPANYLSDFALDQYLVGYQPQSATLANFQKNPGTPNYFGLYGVISLSSAATANLSDQIRTYCMTTLDYDPAGGPPASTASNYPELKLFYDAFTDFQTMNVLSQGLSGFNARLRQRTQELQLPLNIPPLWANNLPPASFWATQFLLNQSAGWSDVWTSEAIDFNAFAEGNTAIFFNPLRAGYVQLQNVTLVDIFGRFVTLPAPNPQAVAETLQGQPPTPLADHPVYLPPRLVQASRLVGEWISATSPDGLQQFTQWNPHPAASPICGWLLPNHLDGSLMLYNADGTALGSLAPMEQVLRWFTVPGEPYKAGIDNRTLMQDDLTNKQANPAMQSLLQTFAYADETAATASNFEKFLGVIDQAQQFIVTKSMQEDQALAVLIGQPLVVARVAVKLQLQGIADVSLDANTYPAWNASAAVQFQMNASGYVPYNFANFDSGGILDLQVPLRIGAVEYQKDGKVTPYFDDGLVGFFVNDDYGTFYTPVNVTNEYLIVSTAFAPAAAATVTPNGAPITLTLILDPRAPVHLTSGILPVTKIQMAADQYAAALRRLLITFLAAPILQDGGGFTLPVPAETGYEWSWWQEGQSADQPVKAAQVNTDAFFPAVPQTIVDGWLKLRKTES